ncbi:hypothetical protein ABEB36_002183 [Hypothenemus hampei]|uniref:Uncharacterized protein n=1 Tax=Hypothenemus hampei TaxID=57062 RepID=A0ABD1F4W9_HYPHA
MRRDTQRGEGERERAEDGGGGGGGDGQAIVHMPKWSGEKGGLKLLPLGRPRTNEQQKPYTPRGEVGGLEDPPKRLAAKFNQSPEGGSAREEVEERLGAALLANSEEKRAVVPFRGGQANGNYG